MKHAHIGLVALAAVLVAGCGGSNNNKMGDEGEGSTAKSFRVLLLPGHGLSEGKIEIEAGKFKKTGTDATLSCPASAGEGGCTVTVKVDDPALGTYAATSTGGQVTVTLPVNPEKERADQEKRRADSEKQRADQEKQRADREKQRADSEKERADDLVEDLAEETQRADETEKEAGGTGSQLLQNNARRVLAGLNAHDASNQAAQAGAAEPTIRPRYRASALVTTAPHLSTPTIVTGTRGKWFSTSITDRDFTTSDRLDVYSDVEAPKRISFRESVYNDGTASDGISNTSGDITVADLYEPRTTASTAEVIDSLGKVVGSLDIAEHTVSGVIASSFPKSGDGEKTFKVVDRGRYTRAMIDAGKQWYRYTNDGDSGTDPTSITGASAHCSPGCDSNGFPTVSSEPRTVRNGTRYPLRYTYETTGSVAGASGTFTCASDSQPPANACGVTNQGNHFFFDGPWVFTPSASAQVSVDDTEYMYFGWWAHQSNPNNTDGTWQFRTFHGPSAAGGNRSTAQEIARLSGTATYTGVAAGYYSFFHPLDSGSDYGPFTARATLTANFTTTGDGSGAEEETVTGTIDQFQGRESRLDWIVTLKQRDIAGGVIPVATSGEDATAGVSWKIKDEAVSAPDAGTWEAAFYSNLPAAKRGGTTTPAEDEEDATPTGIAGTFEAEYHSVGKMIGAFGAHKE